MNRWVKGRICQQGMDYLEELAAELAPNKEAGKGQIQIIKGNKPGNVQGCFTDFFNWWDGYEVNATWQKLIDALVETDKHALAKEIGKALTPPVEVSEIQSEIQPQTQSNVQTETQPEVQSETQSNVQSETQPEVQSKACCEVQQNPPTQGTLNP